MTSEEDLDALPKDEFDLRYRVQNPHGAPPAELLEAVDLALQNFDAVGGEYQSAAELAGFERDAFEGARRKVFVAGREITWVAGWKALQTAVSQRLPCAGHTLFAIQKSLKDSRESLVQNAQKHKLRRRLNDHACIEQGFILTSRRPVIKFIDPEGSRYTYAEVGREWARASVQIVSIPARLSEMVMTCLQNGRILAVEETNNSSVLLTPQQWRNVSPKGLQKRSFYFVLTHQLQKTSTHSYGPRGRDGRRQEVEAMRWLEGLYVELAATGKRPTKADTLNELVHRFRISKTAAEHRVWRNAEIPSWKTGGRPPDALRYHFDSNRK